MDATTLRTARATLAQIMDQVVENHDTVIITRTRGSVVVVMPLEDFNAIEARISGVLEPSDRHNKNTLRPARF